MAYSVKDIPEKNISNHLKPAEEVTREQIAGFFVEELKRMKKEDIPLE